jgi:hypothetical protein
MKLELRVGYLITGSFSPSQISDSLSIIPSKTWKKGDLIYPKGKLKYKEDGWLIEEKFVIEDIEADTQTSDEVEDSNDKEVAYPTIESLTLQLFDNLKPRWEKFKEYGKEYKTELSCVVYYSTQVPELHFSNKTIKLIAELNLNVDIDLYDLSE